MFMRVIYSAHNAQVMGKLIYVQVDRRNYGRPDFDSKPGPLNLSQVFYQLTCCIERKI